MTKIIDIVLTFLGVTFVIGFIGLVLFIGFEMFSPNFIDKNNVRCNQYNVKWECGDDKNCDCYKTCMVQAAERGGKYVRFNGLDCVAATCKGYTRVCR